MQTYWAGRLTLCSDPDDLPRYDQAFEEWFTPRQGGRTRVVDERKPPPPRLAALTPSNQDQSGDGEDDDSPQVHARASGAEVLRNRDLAELTPAEREHLRRLLALLRPEPPTRPSRRRSPSRHGEADPGRTLRDELRGEGEVRQIFRRAHSRRPRKIVLLVDVRGSMQPYADALLRFAHAAARDAPVTEVFTLGTRLTRVTRELRHRDPDAALAAAGAVPDWAGAPGSASCCGPSSTAGGSAAWPGGAVVVVCSDGWERGDRTCSARQMSGCAGWPTGSCGSTRTAGSPATRPGGRDGGGAAAR